MYKLIIIDDEREIREGLKNIVKWEELGFEVVAVLEDGHDAIKFISETVVDVILTDIRMSIMSGIELAEFVAKGDYDIEIILLSGHSDFAYAQQAIASGVAAYLLKPARIEDINAAFITLREKLDNKVKKLHVNIHNENIEFKRQQFFSDILLGAFDRNEIVLEHANCLEFNFSIEHDMCCIASIHVNKENLLPWNYDDDGFDNLIKNLVTFEKQLSMQFIYRMGDIYYVLLCSENLTQEDVQIAVDEIVQNMRNLFNVETTYETSNVYASLVKLAQGWSYEFKSPWRERRKQLVSYIASGNDEMAVALLYNILDIAEHSGIEAVKLAAVEIMENFSGHFFDSTINFYAAINNIQKSQSLEEIKEKSYSIVMKLLLKSEVDNDDYIVEKAKEYIESNYSKNINLEDLSNYVFLSASYFSRFFKQKSGENFVDYLIKVRMEKAKLLLANTNYKTYEISEMVGYRKPRYFSTLFKSYTGKTPTEYREQL